MRFFRFLLLLLCLGGSLWPASGVFAQQPPAGNNPAAAAPAATRPVVRKTGFPRDPLQPFKRGVGWYINIVKFIPIIGLFILWAYSTNWVQEDGKSLKLNVPYWNTLVFLVGLGGFLLCLIVPNYALSFLLVVAAYATPFGFYVKERNERVPESAKVFTPNHIRNVTIRALSRLGINVGTQKVKESALGPPIRFISKSASGKGEDDSRSKQAEKSKGFMAAKELVYDAIMQRATDVHLEPKDAELAVRYRIDGILTSAEPFDRAVGDSIINIFKVIATMDITEKRKPQDGSFRAELENRMIDFRLATQGLRDGEKLTLRILDQSNSVSRLSQLGMRKQLQDQLRDTIRQPHGMFLCCGPTGAGKSTTLFAALHELDAMQVNIITVEDPVEYKMENVTQIEINTKAGQTFAGSLRSILRQDPDVVLIGEIRDEETARIGCQAANTGHMVLSTVHANDTISALYRLIDLGIEPFLLSSALSAILGQRLVRKLCDQCKESYKPKPELLKQAGLPPEKIDVFYRPPGKSEQVCANCNGTGYRGRVGVYELLIINDRIRDMVREGGSVTDIKAEARKNGMLYMKEEGLRLVVKGITSIQELTATVK